MNEHFFLTAYSDENLEIKVERTDSVYKERSTPLNHSFHSFT
jgi:hypothetical protein